MDLSDRIKHHIGQMVIANLALTGEVEELKAQLAALLPAKSEDKGEN